MKNNEYKMIFAHILINAPKSGGEKTNPLTHGAQIHDFD